MPGLIVVAFAVALGSARVIGVKHPAFQATAHLFVGGLFGAYLINRKLEILAVAISLTVLETICFLADRF